MTLRERILTALNREEPDRVPIEFALCPSQMERFWKETGANSPADYFGFGMRGVAIKSTRLKTDFSKYTAGFPDNARVDEWDIGWRRSLLAQKRPPRTYLSSSILMGMSRNSSLISSRSGWMCSTLPDGSDIHVVDDYGHTSHFIWRDPEHILAWAYHPSHGNAFYLYKDGTRNLQVVGKGIMTVNGHCTYLPGGKWVLNDTYPNKERMQKVYLYNCETREKVRLGSFHNPLAMWISDDDMQTWSYKRTLTNFPGKLQYPDGFVDEEEGYVHFAFDYNRHDLIYVGAKLPD